jgi:hypothetical protein
LLQAQRFVEDEAACACKATHLPALLPGGHQLEPKSLLDEHAVILSSRTWSFKENRGLVGFAVGAILSPPKRRGLPLDSDQWRVGWVSIATNRSSSAHTSAIRPLMTTRPLFADAPVTEAGEYVLLNVSVLTGELGGLTAMRGPARTAVHGRDTFTGTAAGGADQGMPM